MSLQNEKVNFKFKERIYIYYIYVVWKYPFLSFQTRKANIHSLYFQSTWLFVIFGSLKIEEKFKF